MTTTVYTLKKKANTDEMHLFECTLTFSGFCTCNQKSICGRMNKSEHHLDIFSCVNEDTAREGSAQRGRKVCGTCVSKLYTTY